MAELTLGDAIRERREAITRIAASHGPTQVRFSDLPHEATPALTAALIRS